MLCYSQSLPIGNIHYPALVVCCRPVCALQAGYAMLQPEPSNRQHTLPSFSCMLRACVCIASRVCYVVATAFQSAMHIFRYWCLILCTHIDTHTQCSSELLSFFGALLRIMCIILFHCSIRAAAFCYLSRTSPNCVQCCVLSAAAARVCACLRVSHHDVTSARCCE